MKRSHVVAAVLGLAVPACAATAASATDYTFTVPLDVNGAPSKSVNVLCAVGAPGTKLTYDNANGAIVGGTRNIAGADGSATASGQLNPASDGAAGHSTGTATVHVTGALAGGAGPAVSPVTGLAIKGASAPAGTYMCAVKGGPSDFFAQPPIVTGNLPVK